MGKQELELSRPAWAPGCEQKKELHQDVWGDPPPIRDLRCFGDPALDRLEIRDGCSVEGDMSVGTVVPVGASFALSGEVETESFATRELRAVADVVGGNDHAKGWVPGRRTGRSGLLARRVSGPSSWFGGGRRGFGRFGYFLGCFFRDFRIDVGARRRAVVAQAVRACDFAPVVDGDIEHAAKVPEGRHGDLGTFKDGFGPFAIHGKLGKLNEDVVVDLQR